MAEREGSRLIGPRCLTYLTHMCPVDNEHETQGVTPGLRPREKKRN